MGQYRNNNNQVEDCFQLHFDSEVTQVLFESQADVANVTGIALKNGQKIINREIPTQYIFCPGEAVGTLHRLGFLEPAYAGFAGPSLKLKIPLSYEQMEHYKNLSHCMEVHSEGIVLAWQANCKENTLTIGVGGTKAFYGDRQPALHEEFAVDRNLVQLNVINTILPDCISLACGRQTHGKTLLLNDLLDLETRAIACRWVGRRAVAYDGFPTLGALYQADTLEKLGNARCTTHLGSGGVSFGPAAVQISRCAFTPSKEALTKKILLYADSKRSHM